MPDWFTGNNVEVLVHGATYFDRLTDEVEKLGRGDHLFFTDWRGDPDERTRDGGPTIAELFCRAAQRGVVVKGLMWRSHLDQFAYSEEQNRHPDAHFEYDFAPRGERSIARGYTKAVLRARRLIYLEDQYLWSKQVSRLFAAALAANPDLHLIAVVPRHPDVDGRLSLPPNQVGRQQAIATCRRAAPDRVHVFDVENHEGTPVYVHAKVCVIDDVWASVGSDNFNRRSWTHDSELSCAVLDDAHDEREPRDPAGLGDCARVFARELRLKLLREHLDLDGGTDDAALIDPSDAVAAVNASANALQAWYDSGRTGPRPPGRLRPHRPERLGLLTRAWAEPVYRAVYDPDGRNYRDRLRRYW
ncbi:phospholipase D-like domain-containing protein [Mycolicibacterium smegmatis]|nr:phospholipase D-like domain-containing protein [Mycolicibacterium smegmatis]MCP2622263.1 phospholipase D-like domain-containing protein [Mycolicibacterium smegmatis]MCP2622560.1 phospholipase D-like domain-containing protein [Mycolicibacterium smegmatis]